MSMVDFDICTMDIYDTNIESIKNYDQSLLRHYVIITLQKLLTESTAEPNISDIFSSAGINIS